MRHAKKSTNRDFRVTFKALPDPSDAGEDEGAETEDDEVCHCIQREVDIISLLLSNAQPSVITTE